MYMNLCVWIYLCKLNVYILLGISHLFPHNELVHLLYIAEATKIGRLEGEEAASNRNSIRALETGDRTRSPYLLP